MIHIPTGELYDKSNRHAELNVFDAAMLRVTDGWITAPRFLEHDRLCYVADGSLSLLVGGERILLSQGEAYAVRRHSTFASCGNGAGRFYMVTYSSTLARYEMLHGQVLALDRYTGYIEALLDEMVALDTGGRECEFLPDAALAMILEKLLSIRQWEPQDRHIAEIVAYIAHHLDEPLSVEELGDMFHYSGDYMGRLFRRRYGMSVKQYVVEQKIAYAKRLLSTSDMPIGAAGSAVGFRDELLFRKFFKYHVGVTPKYYRERYGGKL